MPALRDIQNSLAAAVLTGEPGKFAGHIAEMELGERRLQIYRNHFIISLTECLSATYPVLKALVGESFFNQTARAYAMAHPPVSPVLFEYGEAFPRFLSDATRSPDYAYFTDVGAFEWAINSAYHADDVDALDPADLLSIPEDRRSRMVFYFHPSSQLIDSTFPILDIWRANQAGTEFRTIDLSSGGIDVLVWRNGIDVVWRQLNAAEKTFVSALFNGATLAAAHAQASADEPSFQPNAILADLIGGNALTGFSITPASTER